MSAITPEFQKAVREEGQLVLQTTLQAGMLREEGRYEEAANLCKQVLGRDLIRKNGAINPEALGTLHEYLGDTLRMCGQHDEARLHLEKAMHIQDAIEYGGLGKGERKDGAKCRERLACVMEAQGRMDEARALRLKGEAVGEILCSNISCDGPFRGRSDLRTCSGCRAVFYGSVECQKMDWAKRHKVSCKTYQEEQKTKGKAAADI